MKNETLGRKRILNVPEATAEGTSEEELHRTAFYLFDGIVKTWYMAFRNNYTSWKRLVKGLRVQFLPKDWDYWLKDIKENMKVLVFFKHPWC